MILCPDCSSENELNAPFCLSCGHRFNAPDRSRTLAGDTVPEGQKSIPAARTELAKTQKQSAIKPPGSKDPTKETLEDKSPLLDVDESTDAKTLPFVFIVLFAIALLTALFVFGVFDDDVVELYENKNEVISVPKGVVQDGLSGEARALLLLACERSKKEGDSCEESVFLAGETNEEKLEVSAFRIDKYEVSNFEFQKCVSDGRCEENKKCGIYTHEGKQFGTRPPKVLLTPSHPAVCVSHQDAAEYCAFKGGSLPTKGEFLRAARSEEQRVFSWGNHWDPSVANWAERDVVGTPVLGKIDGYGFTSPQGVFEKGCSAFAVCNLSGNVGEWAKKVGEKTHYRSGGWTDSPFDLRVTREREAVDARTDVGFRCVYKD